MDHDDEHKEDHGDGHDEEDHDDGHDDEHDADERDGEHDEHEAEHHDHGLDMHVWTDPVSTVTIVRAIADTLSQADPDNAQTYVANSEAFANRIENLVVEVDRRLEPVRETPFIVYHDAYRYFEDRFGLSAAGAILGSTHGAPSVRRVRELQHTIDELGVNCVFTEPQFKQKLVNVVIEGTSAKLGIIDPLGVDIQEGAEMYFDLIDGVAESFQDCLR